jgi:hypothetical protein
MVPTEQLVRLDLWAPRALLVLLVTQAQPAQPALSVQLAQLEQSARLEQPAILVRLAL